MLGNFYDCGNQHTDDRSVSTSTHTSIGIGCPNGAQFNKSGHQGCTKYALIKLNCHKITKIYLLMDNNASDMQVDGKGGGGGG